jgi:hypothetical protein
MKVDSGELRAGRGEDGKLTWEEALRWAENLRYAGRSDWRLPNAKELQSLVDYGRSPDTTRSPAIDPVFDCTAIENEGGKTDWAYYWTSTTHVRATSARAGVYLAFGRALGFMSMRGMQGVKKLMDAHGAGAQRSDPKSGDPASIPLGRGPQGDVVRIENLVRCVRGGKADRRTSGPAIVMKARAGRLAGPDAERAGPGERGAPGRGPGGRPPTGADFVRRLDRDGDGKVSESEFDGPPQHFRDFDKNGDGYISEEEAPTGPPPRRR